MGYNINYKKPIFTNLEDFIEAIFISSEIIEYDSFCKDFNKDRVSIDIKIITDRENIPVDSIMILMEIIITMFLFKIKISL